MKSLRTAKITVAGICCALVWACNAGGDRAPRADAPANEGETGSLTVTLSRSVDRDTVAGYIVGYPDTLKLEKLSSGHFAIKNVPAGNHDVIIRAKSATSDIVNLQSNAKNLAIRLKEQSFSAQANLDLGNLTLPEAGSVTGNVTLASTLSPKNATIVFDGTDYTTTPDDAGNFTIDAVPVGEHTLSYDQFGYVSVEQAVTIVEATPTAANNAALAIATSSSGIISPTSSVASGNTGSFSVSPPEGSVQMMVSENSNFSGGVWIDVATTTNYTFSSSGEKTIYIKFKNAADLESTTYTTTITIDPFSSGGTSFTPTFSISTSTIRPATASASLESINVPSAASQMMISNSSDFSGASWQTAASTATFTFASSTDSCGSQTIYLKFKNSEGFESSSGSEETTVYCWKEFATTSAPDGRRYHTAIWADTQMIVWGGANSSSNMQTGGIYVPSSDTWTAISTTSAPSARKNHTAVLTSDSKMIIWGGFSGTDYLQTGGIYNISGGTWSDTSTTSAPTSRSDHSAIWTGSKMIIWGGYGTTGTQNDGALYDPSGDSWTAMTSTNAPDARRYHSTVWTGSKMIVWGGFASSAFNSGGIYDPDADTWTTMSTTSAPDARYWHGAVWADTKMVVWGGYASSGSYPTTGGIYDLSTDSWSAMSTTSQLSERRRHAMVWTGSQVFVFGGYDPSNGYSNEGAYYNVSSDSWTTAPTTDISSRDSHSVVWTGDEALIWGGAKANTFLNTGAGLKPF